MKHGTKNYSKSKPTLEDKKPSEVQSSLDKLNNNMKKSCTRPPDAVENRLMSIKKKEKDKHRAMYIEQLKKEEATVKAKPEISEGSKRLMAKLYVPLYKRLDHIIHEAKKRTQELRNTRELEKQIKEAKEFQSKRMYISTTPKFKRVSMQTVSTNEETTEETEVLNNCTFSPTMDKNSQRLFNKNNRQKKPVFARLLDYGILQANVRQKKLEENVPSFTPDLSYTRKKDVYNTVKVIISV